MAALMTVSHTFMQNWEYVFLASAFNHHQIFDKESVFDVPAWLQDSGGWIEQVPQLLVVNLKEACFDIELFLAHSHCLPHVAYRLREETIVLVTARCPIFLP